MDLKDKIEELTKKIEKYKERVTNEEMTKTAFIMPFFEMLGYDTRNPFEFYPEFTADVADAKGEKVDYAILIEDIPTILIEAKDCNNTLEKADKQLMRYFNVTKAKLAILTNGIVYKFYTDLEEKNIMDDKPFLEINLLNIRDNEIIELKKFYKTNFDISNILSSAEDLKYSNGIKKLLKSEFENPSDNFITYILGEVYDGVKTQKVKDKFVTTIKKSLNEFINEIVRNRLEGALETEKNISDSKEIKQEEIENNIDVEKLPETTQEELEGLGIIKSLVREEIQDINRITFKDTLSYFGLLVDSNTRKWFCRLYFNTDNKYISLPEFDEKGDKTNKEKKYLLENGLNDIYNYKKEITESLKKYL